MSWYVGFISGLVVGALLGGAYHDMCSRTVEGIWECRIQVGEPV
jgi:hypothetical protein